MLVLTRRAGETIVIGSVTRVTVLAVKGDTVRLGVTAPASVRVDRWEVHQRRGPPASVPLLPLSSFLEGNLTMRTARAGDHVQVHYDIRSQDGSVTSSRGKSPLELTVGIEHPRLPGLGLALVGLAPGEGTTLTVPPERAYGPSDPDRVHRWARRRFPSEATLQAGQHVRVTDGRGRRRLVRILKVSSTQVVFDANHRWAGQSLELAVELVAFGPDAPLNPPDPEPQ